MSDKQRIGYYNGNPHAVSFVTRFGQLFLEPQQIIRNNANLMVAQDDELDQKVRQGVLKVLHEGESDSTLYFQPVKKERPLPGADKVVLTSQGGAVKPPALPPTVRIADGQAPTNDPPRPNPTYRQIVEAHEAVPPNVARISAQERPGSVVDEAEQDDQPVGTPVPPPSPRRKISDVIEVNKAGIPLDATPQNDGTVTFEGNTYMSVGALLKFLEATGRATKVVDETPATA